MNKTKQRGNGWSIKLALNLYKIFGYKFIYYLLYPITFVYTILSTNLKSPLKNYYKHHNIKLTYKIFFNHLRFFAIALVDRFITRIDSKNYKFEFEDIDRQLEIFSKATILVLSHFGGWAAASNSSQSKNQMNVVMKEVINSNIKEIENSLEIKTTLNVIDLNKGQIATSIQIANALMRDEVVAIMGDRSFNDDGNISYMFLGEEAYFNKNPFKIAYKTDKPLVAYFIIFVGIQKYKVELIEINLDKTISEEEAIYKAIGEYVLKYEDVVKRYPNQWLNFYNFWEK